MKTISGIYCIENKINGKKYIGSSKNISKREKTHFSQLENLKHKNLKIQGSYNKHGKDNFIFFILEIVENLSKLIEREQHYIDTINPEYNINIIANSSLGIKRSEETKEKIRKANLGLKHPEWRNKIKSEKQGGENHWTRKKKFTQESKEKMSNSQKKLYKDGYISPLKGREKTREEIEKNRIAISKPILQFNLNGILIREWLNSHECQKHGFIPSCISSCCNNKRKTHKKFIWKFKKDYKSQ
jgi:group I intron endonuclease